MACAILLLIVTFTANEATLLHCSPTDGSGSSGVDVHQQVSTIQYCIVDNCTIIRIDTGQKLDIVYTTESIIVINPTDGHTSSVIAKIDDEMPCPLPNIMLYDNQMPQFIGIMTISVLIITMSAYILIVHLLFKELHNLMGKLMISYNLTLAIACMNIVIWLLLHYKIPLHSQMICHIIIILHMIIYLATNTISTCTLTYLANIMYRSYKLKSNISKQRSKFLFKCYTAYVVGTIIFYLFIIIAYDLKTGNGKHTINHSNGYCNFFDDKAYDTLNISDINSVINKVIQIIMFVAYLYYFYKVNTQFEYVNRKYSKHLFVIAISMGANIGLSEFIWLSTAAIELGDSQTASITGAIFLLIQQSVITVTFTCTPKMSRLCKELFSKNKQ